MHIPPKTEEISTDPVSAGKPSLVATHRELTSTDPENDLGEYEESQLKQIKQKRGKRFMGMSAGQRFFPFLFFLIIVVVLSTLFLALSGKIALTFLVALSS